MSVFFLLVLMTVFCVAIYLSPSIANEIIALNEMVVVTRIPVRPTVNKLTVKSKIAYKRKRIRKDALF